MNLIDQITVDMNTGKMSYPKLEGFTLDMDKMYRTVELFMPHCNGSAEQAVKLAIHSQLAAHQGLAQTLAGLR